MDGRAARGLITWSIFLLTGLLVERLAGKNRGSGRTVVNMTSTAFEGSTDFLGGCEFWGEWVFFDRVIQGGGPEKDGEDGIAVVRMGSGWW